MNVRKLFLAILMALTIFTYTNVNAALEDYTTLRDIDKGTYNEYRFYMVNEYFKLKEQFELNGEIDETIVLNLLKYAKTGYNYLPDNLMNKNYLNDLSIAVKKGYETPNSEVNYQEIISKLNTYLESVSIKKITGNIEATPITGNAPLTTTFRGRITDPTGTIIPPSNYIWWVDNSGVKKVIGKGLSINYTFKEEGNFSVFLDVKSTHKNSLGYNDVLPFSTRSIVQVKEKIASLIINVNSNPLRESDSLKFTPEEANYGLIFDATSSTPTGGAKFTRTEWNFGNGVERKYDGDPKIERVVYSREGDYTVSFKLYTNEGKTVERKFVIEVHKPIASIVSNTENGFIGDKFTFSAISSINEKNLSFLWNIIDISNDKILVSKEGSVINYVFSDKGRYNIQLKVKDASGNEDTDTKIIYINSRAPISAFTFSIPDKSKPNRILFDGSKSFDPDFSDEGKLKYVWSVNGEIVDLDQIDSKGAIGYYTFDSIGEQSVVLEVTDPDNMNSIKQLRVSVKSILSVELFTFPRVIQRNGYVRFVASSPNAKIFEWDFGDGENKSGNSNKAEHIYKKSGVFNIKLTVKDSAGDSNQVVKTVYVGESNNVLSVISADYTSTEVPIFDDSACENGAYLVDRIKTVNFKGGESINTDGTTAGLSYSWKIGNKYLTAMNTKYKFDELGCFPIKLTVKNSKGIIDTSQTWVKVINLKPILTSLNIQVQDETKDPVIVSVSALGTKDPDGVIQSYLWYYYTDSDVEPQDFRITALPATTFVLPKITGNYYFVVVMKDNNDEKYSSDESSSNKYSITLSGDNINTPLIDFKVNKNSAYIGEEVIFNATVKNILGQDITSKSSYAWDFDGDGFYDKESSVGSITYKYQNSGTFYTKVRVKYKGMTNVRTIEMNVANILAPKFDYISLGDKYLFFNTSGGKTDKVDWDLGDGNTVSEKNYFSYTYEDGKKSHNVNLKISEGTKTKDITQEVNINMKNMISYKASKGLNLFTFPEVNNDKITLDNSSQKVYININELGDIKNYAVDFDINIDSDLNGGKDDDIDNINDPTYTNAGLLEIILNDKKTQTFRVYLLDSSGKTTDSRDIVIQKKYIKDEEIDLSKVIFNGVSDDEKAKIEKLKAYIKEFPQEDRLKSMQYIQKLQEEWFYANEKTKIILEFESYVDGLQLSNGADIINLLESFLIQGQQDQSVRNMSYNVVKNLIPKELVEYNDIVADLDKIKANPDKLEDNKVLGKEILGMIKDTSLISNEDKITIKSQLQVFIYGSVDNIPKEVVNDVTQPTNKFFGLFSWLFDVIGIIFGVIIFGLIAFFIWYKISNKNTSLGLQDFIIEKTNSKTENDIFGKIPNKIEEEKVKEDFVTRKENKDILKDNENDLPKKDIVEIPETKVEEEKVPDWLKGALENEETKPEEKSQNENIENTPKIIPEETFVEIPETKVEEEKVPDWLKGALGNEEAKPEEKSQNENIENTPIIIPEETFVEIPETKVEEEKVPDWLKGAL
ncbi:MAG: PKD domain-containing protein, partial [Candidatus Gracilibacteria bacterium]|nr:PKD domain-containing protein [Candidatus Gracilibacteria bacterium]